MHAVNMLKQDSAIIWSFFVEFDDQKLLAFKKTLSIGELKRANTFRFHKDYATYITCRWVLRALSGLVLQENPEEVIFSYNNKGKPFYRNHPKIKFNVSHSGTIIIIGFYTNDIGVDVEKIKRDFNPLALATHFFADEEIRALASFDEKKQYQAFYRCWTRKESFIKAVGEGLSYPLKTFAVTMDSDEVAKFTRISPNNENKSSQKWSLHTFTPFKNYIAAITTLGIPKKIICINDVTAMALLKQYKDLKT